MEKENRYCRKCNSLVVEEKEIEEYSYYCEECDENLYEFETYIK